MLEYIDTMVMEGVNRKNQEQKLKTLISKLIEDGYIAILIKTNPNFLELIKSKTKAFISNKDVQFFLCNDINELKDFMGLVNGVKLWHISTIRLLIGDTNLLSKILKEYSEKKFKISNVASGQLQKTCESNLVGLLEFSDDDIAIYGTEAIKKITKTVIQ